MNPKDKKTKKRRAARQVSGSLFGEVNRRVYRFVRDGAVGEYLSGYDKACERYQRTWIYQKVNELKHRCLLQQAETVQEEKKPEGMDNVQMYDETTLPRSFRNRVSEAFENSAIISKLRSAKSWFLYTPLVSYGVMIFGFALFMLISQTLKLFLSIVRSPFAVLSNFSGDDNILVITYMVVAVVLMTVSLTLMFAKKGSLYLFLSESRFGGFFLRHFAGIRETSIHKKSLRRHNGKAFVLGMFLGLVTFFLSPSIFFSILGITVFVAIVLNIPEFGLISLVFTLPFLTVFSHPTVVTVAVSMLIMFSLTIKLLRGKRYFRFEPADLYVLLFMGLVLFGGIFTFGGMASFRSAFVFVALGMMYFVVTIMIKNEEWLKRLLSAFMASSCFVSLIGIAEWVLHKQSALWQDHEVFSTLLGRVVSSWENPNVLACYLLIAFFVSFGCLVGRKSKKIKLLAFVSTLLSLGCLVLTWSRGAWVSFAVVFVVMLLILSHKSIPWVLLILAGGVVLYFFLPDTFVQRVSSIATFSDSSVLYRINIWKGCSALLRSFFFTGVGVGEAAFAEAYPDFALSGIESAPHAHNLFLQITIELGIMGIIVFLILMLLLTRSAFSLFRKRPFSHFTSVSCLTLWSALMALLLNGMTEYVWYNNRIYLLFWIVAGLITAVKRIGENKLEEPLCETDAYDWNAMLARKKKKKSVATKQQ